MGSGRPVELIVECKEDPFEGWRKDVGAQIAPYLELFKPRKLVVASLEPMPEGARRVLEGRGIDVADDLRPKGRGVELLRELARRALRG
jgi:N-acetylglutamate synthase-like GNAT family acetyltransferase